MQTSIKPTTALLLMVIIGIAAISIAWQTHAGTTNKNSFQSDTVPKKEKRLRSTKDQTIIKGDLDKTIEQFDRALENAERQLENQDWEQAREAIKESLQKINTEHIEKQIEAALKNIDAQKIQLQVQSELKKIDWGKMQQALEESKNNIDLKKGELAIQKALDESTAGLNELKKIDVEKLKEAMNDARSSMKVAMGKDFKKEMGKARESMNRVKATLENYREMLFEMEKDGLLNTKGDYKVEFNNGELLINGKKQPAAVIEKYKHYFKKNKVTIKKEKDDDSDDNDKIIDI